VASEDKHEGVFSNNNNFTRDYWIAEKTWQAACEYKDEELIEWKEAARSEAEELVVLIEKAGMLPPPKVIEAVTESLAYCYYNKVSEFKDIDGWYYFDRDNSQLWEPEE
jgi:hypothetical protein